MSIDYPSLSAAFQAVKANNGCAGVDGFKYLGVYFNRGLVMTPFDRPQNKKRVVCYPPPLDMNAYMLKKKVGSDRIVEKYHHEAHEEHEE